MTAAVEELDEMERVTQAKNVLQKEEQVQQVAHKVGKNYF